VAVEVVGQGTKTFTLDYAAGGRVLAETTGDGTVHYLYGHDCLGELRDDEWLYYLDDVTGYVQQTNAPSKLLDRRWKTMYN
jgi:hypothetical protein